MLQLFRNRLATPSLFESTLEPWSDLRREIDRVFDSMLPGGRTIGFQGEKNWIPPMDVEEHDNVILLNIEVPGVNPKDVSIRVDNGLLTISGEKKLERNGDGQPRDAVRIYECRYGRFERSLSLPQYVDADSISARYHDGILTLELPKSADSRRKTIDIVTDNETKQLQAGDRSRKSA